MNMDLYKIVVRNKHYGISDRIQKSLKRGNLLIGERFAYVYDEFSAVSEFYLSGRMSDIFRRSGRGRRRPPDLFRDHCLFPDEGVVHSLEEEHESLPAGIYDPCLFKNRKQIRRS